MAVSKEILELARLALQDRVLTFTERQTIVQKALSEGVSAAEINAVLDNMLARRLESFTKEELRSCPGCGHGVPLISDTCPYCGTMLEHQETTTATPHPNITGKEAEIIRSENVRVEEQNKERCPKCGAPYPLVSNICAHCGYVLHERGESQFNVKNLINNIKQSITDLKNAPKSSFLKVVWHRKSVIFLMAAFYMFMMATMDYLYSINLMRQITYISISVVLLIIATILEKANSKNPPQKVYDDCYFNAIHNHEKYTYELHTLYGDNEEAKAALAEFSRAVSKETLKNKINRILFTVAMVILVSVAFYPFFLKPDYKAYYNEFLAKHKADIEDLEQPPIIIKPHASNAAEGTLADYITVTGDAELMKKCALYSTLDHNEKYDPYPSIRGIRIDVKKPIDITNKELRIRLHPPKGQTYCFNERFENYGNETLSYLLHCMSQGSGGGYLELETLNKKFVNGTIAVTPQWTYTIYLTDKDTF